MASDAGHPSRRAPIGFAPPYIDDDTVAAVERVLRSGWITTGPETAAFEQELAAYTGAPAVACGGSWTGLAGVILDWFGVGPGDEVILPAYTYCATANVVLHRGATPVIVDLPPEGAQDGLNITWEQVEPLLTERTKVVMPVDIGGWPVPCSDWKSRLEQWSRHHGFSYGHPVQSKLGRPLLLSDAAHSLGAEIRNQSVGPQADLTVFSFHAVKNLTTAEGGAVAIALPDGFDQVGVHREIRSRCLHGQSKDAADKFNSQGKHSWKYDVTAPGFKCNMTDIQAAMGRVALARYGQDLAYRRTLADAYDQALAKSGEIVLPLRRDDARRSADHLYVVKLSPGMARHRDDIMDTLADSGIATNVHFPPLPMLTAYRERGFAELDSPNACDAYEAAISLPIHRQMSIDDVFHVADALMAALGKFRDSTNG